MKVHMAMSYLNKYNLVTDIFIQTVQLGYKPDQSMLCSFQQDLKCDNAKKQKKTKPGAFRDKSYVTMKVML